MPSALTSAASEIVPVPVWMMAPLPTVRLPVAFRSTLPLALKVLTPVTSIVPALAHDAAHAAVEISNRAERELVAGKGRHERADIVGQADVDGGVLGSRGRTGVLVGQARHRSRGSAGEDMPRAEIDLQQTDLGEGSEMVIVGVAPEVFSVRSRAFPAPAQKSAQSFSASGPPRRREDACRPAGCSRR